MPTADRIPCEFFLIRYVPDVVKGEFTNIGVLLRRADLAANSSVAPRLRFTRDWTRVQCMHPDVDTALLEGLEAEMLDRLHTETGDPLDYPKHILTTLSDSLSNSIQISERRACLAENLTLELELLMKLHVESLRPPVARRQQEEKTVSPSLDFVRGRLGIRDAMRKSFEKAGVWAFMRKDIPASQYTRPGDPFKLDCGYSAFVPDAEREATGREDILRVFHAVSLASDIESSRSLSFLAPQLREGATRVHKQKCLDEGRKWIGLDFNLTAVVEPIRSVSPEHNPETNAPGFSDEAAELYFFGVFTMKSAGIRVLTTNNLPTAADRARLDLRL